MEEDIRQKGPVYVYMVRGTQNYLLIATATNMEEKLQAIHDGNGPKSLRGRTPVELVYIRQFPNYQEARPVVKRLKGYTRERKDRLVETFLKEWRATGDTSIEQACLVSERIEYPSRA